MALMHKTGCKECNDEITKQVKEALHEANTTSHNHLAEISYALKMLVGINQRLLAKFEEAFGTPKGEPYVITQSTPAQNTAYSGSPLAYDGVIRHMVVSGGGGNITIKVNDKTLPGGSVTLAIVNTLLSGSIPVHLPYRMGIGSTLSISTDNNNNNGVMYLSAWIEPIKESGPEFFRLRR